jgi:hypothetical protein
LAESRDGGRNDFQRGVDIGCGGVATEAEANAGARFGRGQPDGRENVRRFDCAGRAGCAGRAS